MTFPRVPPAQGIILLFLAGLLAAAWMLDMDILQLLGDVLTRLGMNGVLVLSLLPMFNAGLGLNFGLPVAVTAGLLGMCLAVNFRLAGLPGLFGALAFAVPGAVLLGYGYALLLRRVRGREEIAGTFLGFSFVAGMNLFWATAPFTNPAMLWPIGGAGMRPTIGLGPYFGKALNNALPLSLPLGHGSLTIPAGMLVFYGAACLLLWLYYRTRLGKAALAVGENELFAAIHGVDVDRTRLAAVIVSTILGAFGMIVYAQSYGFVELYDAPLMMAFPAASAMLIGGVSGVRGTIPQAVLGALLFQSLYVLSAPIANEVFIPESAEILRMLITNAVILYAFMHRRNPREA